MADRLDRRRSAASQRTLNVDSAPQEDFDMFSNDFGVEPFSIADGYRPTLSAQNANQTPATPSQSSSRRSTALQSSSLSRPDPQKKKPLSNSDGPQGILSRNSFSLRHDAQYSDAPRRVPSVSSTSEMTEVSSARPFSTASRLSMHRPQSIYNGASAPSHPYGMYSQTAALNRQSTTSSHHPSSNRSVSNTQQPTHPYGMYPQATDDANETDPLHGSADIASVGFMGLNGQFARRLGPDGEEADDLIGPDGHTEQLPPYTRYPDGREAGPLPPKQRINTTIIPGSRISHISAEVPQTANSATSMTDGLLSHSAPVDGTANSFVEPPEAQDRSRREKIADKSRQRTCFGRLPVWAVVLMLTLLVIVAAIIGALIGRFLGHPPHGSGPNNHSMPQPDLAMPTITPITTTIHDAAPLQTTASNIPPAPTGDYSLLLTAPSESSTSCLDSMQGMAWSCATGAFLNISVTNPMWDAAQISITSNNTKMGHGNGPPFGAMGPSFPGTVPASLMNDTNDPEFGPALFFYTTFNKTVILPPQAPLNTSGSAMSNASGDPGSPSKRSLFLLRDKVLNLFRRGNSDNDSDDTTQAWVCFWNNTSLEAFIYVEKGTSASNDTAVANSIATTAAPQPTTAPASKRDNKHNHHHDFHNENKGSSNNGWPSNVLPLYPRVVKLQERRDQNMGVPAYCQMMTIEQNNTFTPVPGVGTVHLEESDLGSNNERVVFAPSPRSEGVARELTTRQNVANFCHCEWISQ